MAKIHDKFVIELAEVIKGYGNDPDVDDPFHLSEFYRFYELPEIAVSVNHFKTMIPLEVEKAKERKTGKWIVTSEFDDCCYVKCNQCNVTQIFYYGKPFTNYCPNCGAKMDEGSEKG